MISIIIVNFNNFHLIQNCLSSLEKHVNNSLYEVIIVDNNSTEGDINQVISRFKNVKVILNNVNEGFGKANNIGVRNAKYEYILILNNDTIFIENPFPKLIDFFESLENKKSLIGIKMLNKDLSFQNSIGKFPSITWAVLDNLFVGRLVNYIKQKRIISQIKHEKVITKVEYLHGAFLFLRKKDYLEINGFDENFYFYHEDSDFCYRFHQQKGRIYFLTDTKIIHLGGASSKKMLWFHFNNKMISRKKFIAKHHDKVYLFFFACFESIGMTIRFLFFLIMGIFMFNRKYLKRAIYHSKLIYVRIR